MMSDRKKKDAATEEKGESEKIPCRKDGEMKEKGDPEELKADSYADSDENRNELAQVQSRADHACTAWGRSAEKPFNYEAADQYRRRTAKWHQQYSPIWKDVDLKTIGGKALAVAADQIFSDSAAASCSNDSFTGADQLRCVRRVNRDTGHVIKE